MQKSTFLTDRKAIRAAISLSSGHGLSEYCLPNIYLYRQTHQYVFVEGQLSFIRGYTYDGIPHVMPLFSMAQCPDWLIEDTKSRNGCFYPIPEQALDEIDITRFDLVANPDDADYLYKVAELSDFSRAKLGEKRRQISRLLEKVNLTGIEFSDDHIKHAQQILNEWQSAIDRTWKQTDYEACQEALCLRSRLGLFGYIFYVNDDIPAGFVLAGKLTDTCAVVHFAKALRRYDGIFPYMFNFLARKCIDRFETLNFEQDLGEPGLRQWKRSFAPLTQLNKFRLFPK